MKLSKFLAGSVALGATLLFGLACEAKFLVYPVVSDTYVRQLAPDTDFSDTRELCAWTQPDGERWIYFKFDVKGLAGLEVKSVSLLLEERAGSSEGDCSMGVLLGNDSSWAASMTWDTKPAVGRSLGEYQVATKLEDQQTVTIPLDKGFLAGDGLYTLVLVGVEGPLNTNDNTFVDLESAKDPALGGTAARLQIDVR